MRISAIPCALAIVLNVGHAGAQDVPPQDPDDVVAQVLNYSFFGKDEGCHPCVGRLPAGNLTLERGYWYQVTKCQYKSFASDPTFSVFLPQVIDLNTIDPHNIEFQDAGNFYIIRTDDGSLIPIMFLFYQPEKLSVERLKRGWGLIYSKYCSGKKKAF
jgi:hypothetical protein